MQLTGGFFDYFIVFWGGVLVSFTPCVYPVMPLTASYIAGINTQGTRWMGFFISLIYVLGMAIAYAALGVFAVLTGKIFGQWQTNPYIYLFSGNVILFFALVMLDVIPLPIFGLNARHHIRSKTVWTTLLMGMISGLLIGPCTAPVLGTLLLYVGSKQSVLYGSSLLFVFAYGVGFSLILVGTFVGLLEKLPKSGPWLVRVKQVSGIILLLIAEYLFIKAGGLWI